MTLVEMLIAIFVMAIAVAALVEGLSSGILSLRRAATASTAAAVADKQMEAFRGLSFDAINTTAAPTDGIYNNTSAPYSSPYDATLKIDTLTSCSQSYCKPTQTVATAGGTYRVDTYVKWACPAGGTPTSCSGEAVQSRVMKQVSILVRDNSNPSKLLFSESSNFDALGG